MQRMKGQGNQVPNGPKEQSYSSFPNYTNPLTSMAAASDPYMSSFYMTSPYQTFGVNDGTWSNGEHMQTFLGGYGGQVGYESHSTIDGIFNGGNYSGFNGPTPNFNYGFHGNGDFSAWEGSDVRASAKTYDEYYQRNVYEDDPVKNLEHGVQELSVSDSKPIQDVGAKDPNGFIAGNGTGAYKVSGNVGNSSVVDANTVGPSNHQSKKTLSWASVASQPAKAPPSRRRDKITLSSIVPGRHMDIGTWESKNGGPKSVAPPPAPRPAWEAPRGGSRSTTSTTYTAPPPRTPPQPVIMQQPPPSQDDQPAQMASNVQYSPQPPAQTQDNIPDYPSAQPSLNVNQSPPTAIPQHSHNDSLDSTSSQPAVSPSGKRSPMSQQGSEDFQLNDYNPPEFDMSPKDARFFVIKSYSEDDIHRSIKYKIWCSTEHGNKRLDSAFKERAGKGPIYLFFSVNGSGHFCGMAQMVSSIDYNSSSSVWAQDKWKGQFRVNWIYVKDVPNTPLRHIRLENNENKPVTNSRDTQEVPYEKAKQVLKIIHNYRHSTSIFDDFIHYEKRQEESEFRRVYHHQTQPYNQSYKDRNDERRPQGDYRGGHRGDPRNDHRGDPRNDHRGDPRNDHRGDPRNDHRGDPRNDHRGDPRNDHRGDTRNDHRGDPRNDHLCDPRNDHRGGDPKNDHRGDPRNDYRGDPRADNRGYDNRGGHRDYRAPHRDYYRGARGGYRGHYYPQRGGGPRQ